MFNNYSKFVTAFAAFALLFSTGAWSQCAEGEIAVDYSVGGGSWDSEISWILNDSEGNTLYTGGAPESGQWCLAVDDYTFLGSDAYGDGWNGGSASFSSGGVEIGYLAVEGDNGSIVISVSADVPGCMDDTASNYNADATVDDGSCCYGDLVTVNLYDSFGDGWSWAGVEGGMIFEGNYYPFLTGGSLSLDFCLPAGCYTAELILDQYASEASWDVTVGGEVIALGSSSDMFFSTDPACIVYGCSDETACNYLPGSNVNDGSCEYLSCAGCTDLLACNWDMDATLDDGSCDYTCIGCMDDTANNYDPAATIACEDCCTYCELTQYVFTITDSFGDGICCAYGEGSYSISVGGEVVASGGEFASEESTTLCVDGDACLVVTIVPDNYPGETGWTLTSNGEEVGSGDGFSDVTTFGTCVTGCSDDTACNYDELADIDDGSCDYSCIGCTDSGAANFDPNATVDSGLCVYCDPGTFVFTISMTDSFGDGWNGAEYYVYNQTSGELELQGSLDAAFSGDGLSEGADLVCLAPGCYSVQVSAGSFPAEIGITMTDQFGTNYGSTGGDTTYPVDFTLTGACEFEGCTSATALNYNISATIDDGSCQEPPANDQLDNAEAVACGAYANGSLLFATDDQGLIGSEFAGNAVATAGVWYVYNAAGDQQVTVSTCDTPTNDGATDYTGDTKLHVYTQGVDGLEGVGSNDDGCDTGFLSTAIFNAATGSDYYIYVSEYSPFSNGNDFVLSIECADCSDVPSNDNCEDAIAQVDGVTFTGSTCCSAQESIDIPWAGFATAYGVWFTFNSSNYDSFDFNATNLSNEVLGFGMMDGACDAISPVAGCQFTGTCAGNVSAFIDLEPDTDYYFVLWTTDPSTCGEFEFTTNGVIFGCTDAAANNYNMDATDEDGSCDFDGVVPANDICDNAVDLACNAVTTGSTGGATITGSPLGVAGCEAAPGAGVWYSFVGNGQLHNLSTCGSAVDSKINIYTASEACGGGGIDVPPADACGADVTTNINVGGGTWDSEISWELLDATSAIVASGVAGSSSQCLAPGDYTLNMYDAYGDGWNGGSASFVDALGDVMGYATLTEGSFNDAGITIAAYDTAPSYQAGDFDCYASASSSDGTGACTLFDADDVNFEFISEVGTLYYVLVGSEGTPGAFDLDFSCADIVEGCTNVAACNYDEYANVDDDSCDFWSCVCDTESGTAIQLNMNDAFGDGWNDAGYTISDLAGNLVFEGSLDDAQFFVDEDNFTGPEYGFDLLCLEPGCYNISVSPGSWASEVSWDISTEDGTVLVAGGAPDSQTISVGGAVCGCTDAGACNYDDTATDDDGTCEYETCAGCTDMSSCSYNADATIDDGSCCFDNCVTVQMMDAFGDGWGGYGEDGDVGYVISTVDGVEVGSGMLETGSFGENTHCLAAGCYTITVNEFTFSSEISWTIIGAFGGLVSGISPDEQTFNVGSGDQCVVGCDISCACNYDPNANISDVAQCVFSGCDGCTYPDASNYDGAAISDDGSCTFDIANPCPADLNGDGSITTGDLLIFLGAFGTICE